MRRPKKIYCYLMLFILVITAAACNTAKTGKGDSPGAEATTIGASAEGTSAAAAEGKEDNQDIMILFTSDVHCGVDEGFGYAGLSQIRDTLKSRGYTTLLVDDGDFVQGEAIGTISKGESLIEIMNALSLKYPPDGTA